MRQLEDGRSISPDVIDLLHLLLVTFAFPSLFPPPRPEISSLINNKIAGPRARRIELSLFRT